MTFIFIANALVKLTKSVIHSALSNLNMFEFKQISNIRYYCSNLISCLNSKFCLTFSTLNPLKIIVI